MAERGDGAGHVSASEQAIARPWPGVPARPRDSRAWSGRSRWATEIPAAALVAVEILVLLIGVISRYVFNAPLTWSDELASTLFLWLAMLGAVIALRRAEHMRLAFLVGLAPPRWRHLLETFATMVVAAFLVAHDRAGARLRRDPVVHHHAGAGNPRRLPGRGDRSRRRAHAGDRGGAPDRAREPRRCRRRAGGGARDRLRDCGWRGRCWRKSATSTC